VTLVLRLGADARVDVRVFDAGGRDVARPLTRAWLAAGTRSLRLDLGALPAGLYFCEARAGSARAVTRVVRLR
jgi:hypothetical protein